MTILTDFWGKKPESVFEMSRKTKTTRTTRKTKRFIPASSNSAVANPSLMLGSAPSNPTPVPVYTDKWVRRTYAAALSVQNPLKEASFPPSVFNLPGRFFVDKMQVWKVGDNDTSVGIKATFKQGVFTDLGVDDVIATDYGTSSSLPGVSCKVPAGHAVSVAPEADILAVCAPVFPDASTNTSATFVCHLHCWIAI